MSEKYFPFFSFLTLYCVLPLHHIVTCVRIKILLHDIFNFKHLKNENQSLLCVFKYSGMKGVHTSLNTLIYI